MKKPPATFNEVTRTGSYAHPIHGDALLPGAKVEEGKNPNPPNLAAKRGTDQAQKSLRKKYEKQKSPPE